MKASYDEFHDASSHCGISLGMLNSMNLNVVVNGSAFGCFHAGFAQILANGKY